MGDERTARMAKNEALFRSVTERVNDLSDGLSLVGIVDPRRYEEYLCECVDIACVDRVRVTEGEYERVRSNSLWFLVALGHLAPEIERVIEENERFAMVEKGPGQQAIVIATDPRRE
jgi:hypothetical protein